MTDRATARLSPLAIPFRVANSLARVIGPLVVLAITTGALIDLRFVPLVWLGVLGVVGLVVLREVAYVSRFQIDTVGETLSIRSGVIARRDRDIPVERIHNVDVRQNVLHRLAGIAAVDIETAGGSDTEATLRYVDLTTADRLRNLRGAHRPTGGMGDDTTDRELYAITGHELLLLGLLSWDLRIISGLSVLASLVGPPVFLGALESPTVAGFALEFGTATVLAGTFLAVVLGSGLLSGASAVSNYWNFSLTRAGDELRYERGLFRRYEGTIPLEKVQAASVAEPVPMRWFGYASLTVATAGYGPDENRTRLAAVPIASTERVWSLLHSIEPVEQGVLRRPPGRARRRYAVRYLLALLAITAVVYGALTTFVPGTTRYLTLWALLALVALVLVPLAAHAKWTSRGYRFDDEHVVTRIGWWSRRTTVVPDYRVQTVIDRASPFQRRWSLASVVIDTAVGGGLGGTDAVIADLDDAEAITVREAVADRLAAALSTRGRTGG